MARVSSGSQHIRVEGLTELQRALKKIDGFERELSKTNRETAQMVMADARGEAQSQGSTAAHVAPAIKTTASATYAAVSLLTSGRYAMAAGAEFGSDRYRQFKKWTGFGENAGYFMWPTIRRDADKIQHKYESGMDDLLKRANLK